MLSIDADWRTDQGDRERNEDCAEILDDGRVCLVADGMGGQGGGEVASRLAAQVVAGAVADGSWEGLAGTEEVFPWLQAVFSRANQQLLDCGHQAGHRLDMGTTLTLALIREEGLFFGHLGDSRLYLQQDGDWEQLSEDHTQAQEFVRRGWFSPEKAARSRFHHVLTRYLGMPRTPAPQFGTRTLRTGARLLLCSDGLHNEVDSAQLGRMLGADRTAGELATSLVAAARGHARSGLDNITALVVRPEWPERS